jgi:SnoaL-like polyketide cyclase
MHVHKSLVSAIAMGSWAVSASADPPKSQGAQAAYNELLGRRYFEEVWNQGKLDVLNELLAPNYVNHTPSTPDPPPGPAGLKPIVQAIRQAFPDLHYELEDLIATDEKVVMRVRMTGTHQSCSACRRPGDGSPSDRSTSSVSSRAGSSSTGA